MKNHRIVTTSLSRCCRYSLCHRYHCATKTTEDKHAHDLARQTLENIQSPFKISFFIATYLSVSLAATCRRNARDFQLDRIHENMTTKKKKCNGDEGPKLCGRASWSLTLTKRRCLTRTALTTILTATRRCLTDRHVLV